MSDHQRTLSKWLNEEQTGPIDRVAMAHVLGEIEALKAALVYISNVCSVYTTKQCLDALTESHEKARGTLAAMKETK